MLDKQYISFEFCEYPNRFITWFCFITLFSFSLIFTLVSSEHLGESISNSFLFKPVSFDTYCIIHVFVRLNTVELLNSSCVGLENAIPIVNRF